MSHRGPTLGKKGPPAMKKKSKTKPKKHPTWLEAVRGLLNAVVMIVSIRA